MRTKGLFLLTALILLALPRTTLGQARIEENIVVGMYSGLALVMDVYYPESPNGYGIVHISGSGFNRPLAYNARPLSKAQVRLYGQPLVEQGYTVFSLSHRSTPRFQYPAPVEDVQRAVRHIRYHAAEFGINPNRIGAVGGSSGGYLVSMLGVLDNEGDPDDPDPVNQVSAKVQTVVARAPVTNLLREGFLEESDGYALLMGFWPSDDPQTLEFKKYTEASPINHITIDDPPFLLLHGDIDDVVPYEQSAAFFSRLKEMGIESHLLTIPGGGHNPLFGSPPNPPDYIGAMVGWFKEHLVE